MEHDRNLTSAGYDQPPYDPPQNVQPPPQYGQPPQYSQGQSAGYDQPPKGPAQNYTAQQPQYGQPQPGQPQYGQPQYGQPQYGPSQQNVIINQPAPSTLVVQHMLVRPPNYLWLSCLVYWFCNCIMGGIAFGLSMASSAAADENRMEQARSYGRGAFWVSIAAVGLGVITIIIASVLLAKAVNDVDDALDDALHKKLGGTTFSPLW